MLKIIYAGTPEFAVPALERLLKSNHEVVAVYTQPDRPAGRGRKLQQSPVKACALEKFIPVYQPSSFKEAADVKTLVELEADLMIVAAYGLLLPQVILDAPRLGCINIHASLLPRWRGAAPVQRAILAGDNKTGITIMQMELGLDTGDMLSKQSLEISQDWSAGELHDHLMQQGADLLMPTLDLIENNEITPEPQIDADTCYAAKLTKSEARLDWSKPAEILHREVRAFSPWPVSFAQLDGKMLRIWRAGLIDKDSSAQPGIVLEHTRDGFLVACGSGVLQVTELQFEGKKKCTAAEILNSRNLTGLSLV